MNERIRLTRLRTGRFKPLSENNSAIWRTAEDVKASWLLKPPGPSCQMNKHLTAIGAAHKQAIVALVKRKRGFALLAKMSNKVADLVGRTIEVNLKLFGSRVKMLSVGHGREFAGHQAVDQAHGIQTYFADPYCSWQRGNNQNFNGLLRKYIPQKRHMETVTVDVISYDRKRMKHRASKRPGFKTPHEVIHASLNALHPALESAHQNKYISKRRWTFSQIRSEEWDINPNFTPI